MSCGNPRMGPSQERKVCMAVCVYVLVRYCGTDVRASQVTTIPP